MTIEEKSLFDSDYRYTPDATDLDLQTYHACKDIFAAFIAKGFSPREVSHLMQLSVADLELSSVLGEKFFPLKIKKR